MGIRESLLNTITSVADSDFVRIVTSAGASSKATVRNLFKGFESNLGAKSSLTVSDYVRVVGSDNEAYKQSVGDVKNSMGVTALESNMGSTLANGTDLNSLTLPANDRKIKIYHGQDITQMINAPSAIINAWPFCLELVPIGTEGTYTKQILHIYGTTGVPNNIYVRAQTYTSGGTAWTAWMQDPTRAEVDALNSNLSNLIRYKDYTFSNLAFTADAVGTRGLQQQISLTSDIATYGTPVAISIVSIADSGKCIFQAFIFSSTLYLNGYRASANSMSNNNVIVRVAFRKA